MTTEEVIQNEATYLVQVYKRPRVVFERGDGVYLFDKEGRKYLDFVAGLGVNALGYRPRDVVEAISRQAEKLIHCSNLYHSEPAVELASLLIDNSFADRAFFCNSGAEAAEAAMKFARKWAAENSGRQCHEIVAFEGSFHGRTYGALSATSQPKYWKGFEPMLPGIRSLPFNQVEGLEAAISDGTCAAIVEPVQGEGGVRPCTHEFLSSLREVCDRHGVLLIMDEVQCGLGRTGSLFAYRNYDVEPDILTLAKPLAGGLPIGAVLVREKVATALGPGNHGSTFGANPVACAVAATVLKRLLEDDLPGRAKQLGTYFMVQLNLLKKEFPFIREVRGLGLMIGMELDIDCEQIVARCRERGLLVCKAGDNVLRFLPPLIIEKEHIDTVVATLEEVLAHLEHRAEGVEP